MKCQEEKSGRYSEMDVIAAKKIWSFMNMRHTIEKSDVILVLGNNDTRTAELASQLFNDGFGDWLLFSGKDGSLTKGKWTRPEAEVFREVAVGLGVPEDRIITEPRATNTGENILFSYKALEDADLHPQKIILVHTPYMERRTYATFMKQYPNASSVQVIITSPHFSLEEYPNEHVGTLDDVIDVMIGSLKRIKDYPAKGFQIYQNIPTDVWQAYKQLEKTASDKLN